MDGDRERWNAKWRERAGDLEPPTAFVEAQLPRLPSRGKALDIAGGAGRNAAVLARHGLDVTIVDNADVALHQAERRGLPFRLLRHDLDEPLPLAPLFDVVLVIDYLNRAQRDAFAELLVVGGFLVAMQATVTNLERHPSPSRRFLLEEGELAAWATSLGLVIEHAHEGWSGEGRHVAELVARRAPRTHVRPPTDPSMPSTGPYR